jgi:UDP-glucose 4-epimerase
MIQGRQPRIDGDGLQSRDFTFVGNAVQALLLAAKAPSVSGKVYNIGTGATTSVLDVVAQLNELLGKRLIPVHGPARAGDVRHSQADISRAGADLGYAPTVRFRDGLRRTLDEYRSNLGDVMQSTGVASAVEEQLNLQHV